MEKEITLETGLHVEDHCAAIDNIFHEGEIGETYCVGGDNELQNIEIIEIICEMMEKILKAILRT